MIEFKDYIKGQNLDFRNYKSEFDDEFFQTLDQYLGTNERPKVIALQFPNTLPEETHPKVLQLILKYTFIKKVNINATNILLACELNNINFPELEAVLFNRHTNSKDVHQFARDILGVYSYQALAQRCQMLYHKEGDLKYYHDAFKINSINEVIRHLNQAKDIYSLLVGYHICTSKKLIANKNLQIVTGVKQHLIKLLVAALINAPSNNDRRDILKKLQGSGLTDNKTDLLIKNTLTRLDEQKNGIKFEVWLYRQLKDQAVLDLSAYAPLIDDTLLDDIKTLMQGKDTFIYELILPDDLDAKYKQHVLDICDANPLLTKIKCASMQNDPEVLAKLQRNTLLTSPTTRAYFVDLVEKDNKSEGNLEQLIDRYLKEFTADDINNAVSAQYKATAFDEMRDEVVTVIKVMKAIVDASSLQDATELFKQLNSYSKISKCARVLEYQFMSDKDVKQAQLELVHLAMRKLSFELIKHKPLERKIKIDSVLKSTLINLPMAYRYKTLLQELSKLIDGFDKLNPSLDIPNWIYDNILNEKPKVSESQFHLYEAIQTSNLNNFKKILTTHVDQQHIQGYKHKDFINKKMPNGMTLLHEACKKDSTADIVRYLLENDASPELENGSGQTPLHIALANGSAKCAIWLLLKNPNLHLSEREEQAFLTQMDGGFKSTLVNYLIEVTKGHSDEYRLNQGLKQLENIAQLIEPPVQAGIQPKQSLMTKIINKPTGLGLQRLFSSGEGTMAIKMIRAEIKARKDEIEAHKQQFASRHTPESKK